MPVLFSAPVAAARTFACLRRAILGALVFLPANLAAAHPSSPYLPAEPVPTVQAPDSAKRTIRITDLLQIRQPSSLTLSPDGRLAAFTLKDVVEDGQAPGGYRYETHLWVVPIDGSSAPRALTGGPRGVSQPVWHPSGKVLTFVRQPEQGGSPQVHALALDGGEAVALTDHPGGASSPRWSPDGTRLSYTSSVGHSELLADSAHAEGPAWRQERPGRDPAAILAGAEPDPDGSIEQIRAWLDRNEREGEPRVVDRLNLQGETDLAPEIRYSHLHVLQVAENREQAESLEWLRGWKAGRGVPLTQGYFSFAAGGWSANGASLFVTAALDSARHPDRVDNADVYRLDLPQAGALAGPSRPVPVLTSERYSYFSPLPSPDGRHLLALARDLEDRGYGQTRLHLLDLQSGDLVDLSAEFDRSVSSPAWAADSRSVYFTANSNGGTPLYRIGLRNLRRGVQVERLTTFESGVRSYDAGPEGIAYVLTEVANPYELYAARADGSRARALSDFNASWLEGVALSQPVRERLTRPDGTLVEYWVMEPTRREEGRTYPLMLQIHGGPSAMWGPGEATMWLEFQYFTAMGYGIVYANPRGSGGYGREFQAANYRNWGAGPAGDVLAAAERAAALDWADPDRQVVTGGSYAGYLTAWIVGNDQRFKAAFAQRGVYDLETFMGEGNAWRLIPNHFGGYPWEEGMMEILERESPQHYVENIRTPLLIKHGDVDLRTGVIQSELLYKSLKILERPVEYVRYPRASHEMSRSGEPLHRMDRILRIHEFFSRFI